MIWEKIPFEKFLTEVLMNLRCFAYVCNFFDAPSYSNQIKVTFWFYNQFFKTSAADLRTIGTFISSKYHRDPSNCWSWNSTPECTTGFSGPSHFLKVRQLIGLHPSELVTVRWMNVLRARGSVPSFRVWANQSASGSGRTICTLTLSWCPLLTLFYPTAAFEGNNPTQDTISWVSLSADTLGFLLSNWINVILLWI